jgi:hypothetical protein
MRTSPLRRERVPGERVPDDVEHVEDEEAAVRTMKRPGLDVAKVGRHRAERGPVLAAPEEVVVGRVALDDDGRAFCAVGRDEDVHPVPHEVAGTRAECDLERGLLAFAKVRDVGEQVVLHVLEVLERLRHVSEPLREVVEERVGGEESDLALELPFAPARLLLESPQPTHEPRGALLHLGRGRGDRRLLLFGKVLELFAWTSGTEATPTSVVLSAIIRSAANSVSSSSSRWRCVAISALISR